MYKPDVSLIEITDRELHDRIHSVPKEVLGARVKEAREAAGFSHDTLGRLCDGMARQSLIAIEKGQSWPRAKTLRKIAEKTNRDLESFLVGAEVTNGKPPFRSRAARRA